LRGRIFRRGGVTSAHCIALLASNPAQPSTTPYKRQDAVALNLYYNCAQRKNPRRSVCNGTNEILKFYTPWHKIYCGEVSRTAAGKFKI